MIHTLEDIQPGSSGVIAKVGNEKGAVKRRLVDMGLTPGTTVTVKKVAPFGDPLEVCLRGYSLSLRKADAAQIEMCPPGEIPVQKPHRHEKQGMVQHIPDEETLRRMQAAHEHEHKEHTGTPSYADHDSREMKLALVGNPNCGKTTLFNALTGSNQYVGNWPGVTVEKKEGYAQVDGKRVTIVDLPGIYSLSPYSMEEIVARDFIVEEHPDAIINIVDATNIERNLYLTAQLLELERPMVVALNFMDEVEKRGDRLDVEKLSQALGVPVIPITARTGENVEEMLRVAHEQMHVGVTVEPDDLYDDFTHEIHHAVGDLIHDRAYAVGLPAHWCAIKLIEGDEVVAEKLGLSSEERAGLEQILESYERAYDLGDRETLVADSRYHFIQNVVAQAVVKGKKADAATLSDKIDSIVTHKIFAVPAFLCTMLFMFAVTFGPIGSFLSHWFLPVGRGGPFYQRFSGSASECPVGECRNLALVAESGGGRNIQRGGRRAYLPAPDRPALFLSVHSGRYRLYGPGRFYHGPSSSPVRSVRQGLYSHAHGLWLYRARRYGGQDDGE